VGRIGWLLHRVVRSDLPLSPGSELALCERCGDETVVPVCWEPDGRSCWWIRLRCGSCSSFRDVVATDEHALALDARIHGRAQPIADAIARLDRERMTRLADALTLALEYDLVDAQDFACPGRRASQARPKP
jgi:hypothetical protein